MATHSFIAIKSGENQYKSVYCHFDGDLRGVGAMLHKHYQDETKVTNLIEQGDMSFLAENIHPKPGVPHSFRDYQKGTSVFYGRDRGEMNTHAKTHSSVQALIDHAGGHYVYLYAEGQWYALYTDGTVLSLKNLCKNF